MKKIDIIKSVLHDRYFLPPQNAVVKTFAPTNIALVKYWGKRDQELNLPVTSSLSVSLGKKGAETELKINNKDSDFILLNNVAIEHTSGFAHRLVGFLDLFRDQHKCYFDINIQSNIPIAAGLASSACGFAALVQALNELYGWKLTLAELSILARLGSGSAARSLWNGFVEWQMGLRMDGMDSHGVKLQQSWPELCVGLLIMQEKEKSISSREAMQRTVVTSPLYSGWSGKVHQDLPLIKRAIQEFNFELLGKTAESNAMTMHALMLSAWPPVSYALPETIMAMQKVWQLRNAGMQVYFTQDAGPNLKLLFLRKDINAIKEIFTGVEVVHPFG